MAISLRCARRNRNRDTAGPQDAMQVFSALAVESHPSGPSSGKHVRWTTGAGGICLSEPSGPWRASGLFAWSGPGGQLAVVRRWGTPIGTLK